MLGRITVGGVNGTDVVGYPLKNLQRVVQVGKVKGWVKMVQIQVRNSGRGVRDNVGQLTQLVCS